MKPTQQQPNPWVPRHSFDTLQRRAELAEECVRRLLNTINPALLERHAFDWKAATDEVCDE